MLLSIDQYMDMHQHFHNTPPQWKLPWIVNQKKQRDDYVNKEQNPIHLPITEICLLYTSDAADDLLCVDLGGRRII